MRQDCFKLPPAVPAILSTASCNSWEMNPCMKISLLESASTAFSRASGPWPVVSLSSDWLLVISSFILIGHSDHLSADFTMHNRLAKCFRFSAMTYYIKTFSYKSLAKHKMYVNCVNSVVFLFSSHKLGTVFNKILTFVCLLLW